MTPDTSELELWLERRTAPGWIWFAKYIAANDTYAKPNVHQGGPYVAKELLRAAFPRLLERVESVENPDLTLHAAIDSHGDERDVRVVYYNSRVLGQPNGRDEARITRWGGRENPLLAPEATGSLAVFAYRLRENEDPAECRIWLCRNSPEEDTVIARIGPVEPGIGLLVSPSGKPIAIDTELHDLLCAVTRQSWPETWSADFPTGEEILHEVIGRTPSARRLPVDRRLLMRRECEYTLFRSIEEILSLPRIREGFATVDLFVQFANAVTNRRKSRAGRSLELHARAIFDEEQLPYSHGRATEDKRTPDFVFPSIERYHDDDWPAEKLRMLAAKTTCKDRWRQVTTEAARIPVKHLLTLQEGVSEPQHREMQDEGVTLVVPAGLVAAYPDEVQPHLVTLAQFIASTRAACE